MTSPPVEILLLNQVASYLATPIVVVDAAGDVTYYNEPAEALLGRRYEESGQMPLEVWGTIFAPTDMDGAPLRAEDTPLALALRRRIPVEGSIWIQGLDGIRRLIVVTAIPLTGPTGVTHGAAAIFWEE